MKLPRSLSSRSAATTLAVLVFSLAFPRVKAAETPPNILFILADDLGWGDTGFNGRKEWRTPSLDRLARQGVVFQRWYTPYVVCAPARAAIMTGKYGIHNGVTANNDDLPRNQVTIAQALKQRGYATALFGKWHHGKPRPGETNYVHPLDRGFDEFYGFTDAIHAWQHFPTNLWDGRELKPSAGYSATRFADRSIDFIRRQKGHPFFLYLAFNEPHFQIEAPPADVAKFTGKFKEKDPNIPLNATYAAMISRLDAEVGRVVKALEAEGLRGNTLIVFSSDNGATFEKGNQGTSNFHDSNGPFRGQKRLLWEGGIRVPGFACWPGKIPSRQTSKIPGHMIDLFPTFLAAAGGQPDPAWRVDGVNLLDVWTSKATPPERTLFWEWRTEGYNQAAAMRGDFKLIVTGRTPPELYNLAADPAERRTVMAEYPEIGNALRRDIVKWLATETESAKWGKTNQPVPLGP